METRSDIERTTELKLATDPTAMALRRRTAAGSKVNDFWPCDQLRCDNTGFKPNGVWRIRTLSVENVPASTGTGLSFGLSFVAAAMGTVIIGGLLFVALRRRLRS
jgi:hypothetical protein